MSLDDLKAAPPSSAEDSALENRSDEKVSLADSPPDWEARLKEKEEKYLYLYSEFETFKKRVARERGDWLKFGWESIARDLLECVDNLERSLAYAPPGIDPSFLEGVRQTQNHFLSVLGKQGVQAIEAIGKPFDPHFQEALGQVSSEEWPEGVVCQEFKRGYTLHGRLLRPAQVQISQGKKEEA